ncbi:Destruxin synthetase [Pyrenophora teres f. teres]|uniref:Destruxin synthetase n=1 Tax=Pyrenophora teres f. teres TaxID=97479 RepID=A0A6S6WI21_9PLEO|nr:Destruxin synthetase [Pyrenophora teres f. teres]
MFLENIVSKLKNDRDLSRHPLVQLVFAVHAQRDLGQLKWRVGNRELRDTVTSSVMFSTDLYARDDDNMLGSMPLLRDADYAKLDAMGLVRVEKTAYPRDSSVVDLFREQAAACPSRVAVKDSVAEMTYAQLDAASDVLARWLARRSLAPETLVGVFASRSCEAIVAFLGILKANLAYLPFDVKTPATRMEDILSSRPGHRLILVGAGAQLPSTKLSNIEFVSITEALDEQSAEKPGLQMPTTPMGLPPPAWPMSCLLQDPRSAQGVMVEHRGIVRLVRDNNLVQHLPSSPVMAHMANLAFDASTWEIYGTSSDLRAAEQYLTGKFVNGYGPTENTTFSTTFLVSKNEQYTNGVPIGRALSNSGAYVMDSGLRLVPLGVVGELVVTGDGLARGYTDPARNVDRFVSVEIGGKTVRAYRTGDYVRHRPTDGQLEFFGRMDGQVKIRGNRVELGEIEHTLRSDKVVREAVAVLQQHDGSEARLAGFVTVHEDAETADEHVDDSNESQHVDVWEEKFDADIYSPIDSVQAENIGRDFVGWTSMYDGSDIDTAEMNEWLDDTIATMLNGQRPGNVLEIGSGTGMILFNLGDGLQSYVGLDPSRKAVQFIAETAKSIPGLASKIRMYKATAADVGRLEQPVAASLVVVNSVVQYFPSLDYLFKMVQQLVELEGTRTLFFGDVRSCALHREFLATRAVHMAGDKATKADIRRMVADMERVERELLVDPAFFTALPSRLPGLVEHVEILPKKMKATNELSCYRYAAVVHVRPRDGQTQELAIRDVAHDRWIDFAERRLDRQSLLQQLKSLSSAPAVAVSNIPYSKTIVSRCLVHSLDGTEAETPDSPDWLASVHQRAQDCPSLSATELVELAQEVDCRVEISWSRQHSQQGGLDAIFHRYQPLTGERVMFRFPTDHAERPLHSLSSRPLRQQFLQKTQQRLLEMLEAQLPTYMVPQTLAILDAMPVNQNGKVDRKALEQQIDTQKGQSGLKRQPETETQRTMQQLWAGVLAIDADSIGLDDSFFRLGGDSIAAMKLVGEARRAGIHLTVADLFRNPKLDQLTAAAIASAHASPASIPQVEHAGPVAQSFAQGRLWFLEELHPGLTWYLMPLAVRIRGPLDLVALHSALLAVERRHETLRTTFATVDGASVQVVQPFQAKDLNIIDIVPGDEQGLTEAVHQDHSTPFDLRTEPGWRVTVYRMSNDDHVLSTVMHHIISDGWSVDVLMRELAAFYSASMRGQDPLSQVQPLSVQYRDFSVWQREQAQADEHQKQLSYWVEQLQSSRPAELLCDKPRPAALSGEAGVQSIEIAGPLYAKLQSFCQLHGVTQFVVLLAAFRATHFRLTGQEDATIGTPNANRDRWEVKDMVGFFVNMQCLRIKIGDESFEELVQQVHEVAVASHANADVPFENIVSKLKNDRDLSRHPLVQLVFAVHAQRDLGQLKLEGVETENLGDTVTSRFDLEFHFSQQADGLWGSVMFSTDLYAPETIDNMLSVFRRVLETCLEQPQAAVASMPLLRDADYAKLDAMGLVRVEKTAYPRDSSVVDLFREQAAACPSRVAVKDSVAEMTYAQLDAASDVLARWLARRSLAPETLVGVFASRSCEAIVAFLGILKANLAYLPFDVKTPATRMEDILSSRPGHRLILFVSITEALDEQSAEKPGLQMPTTPMGLPHQPGLCHVYFRIHRSAQGSHGGASRHCAPGARQQSGAAPSVLASHGAHGQPRFDATTLEIYACLLHGGTLVCVDSATVLEVEAVLRIFREHHISTAFMAPSLFRTYALQSPGIFAALDMLYVGGEAVYPHDLVAASECLGGRLVNAYGPTENTVASTSFLVSKEEAYANGVPIGRALSNSGAYVMDSGLRLVPLGVVGELVVTGDGLARGYTDPARNVDRFVSVEIGGKTVRAYRTGDYVRHRPTDGQLEFFGRMDGQVKIRGNRVELGEIEHTLRSDKVVREAVAVLQQHDGSEARLAGFVTVHEDAETADEHVDDSNESQHVDVWEEKFDADIYSPIDSVQAENIGRDFVGWTSMYDGSDIDTAEMNEWLDDTIATMLNGQRPGNVLEIGSGTGMILFNLGDGLQSYVGLDPSRKAVQFIAETAKSIPGLASKIRMYKATAADVGRLEQPVAASLVVVNSVVQYFPSLDYLFKMVQQLVELEGTRTLFFGDVRSCALHREFLATRAVHMAGDKATKADIRRMVADMERVERELLVDPAFFTALPSRLPGLVEHVEILPKKMKATNELSCYRYAAVVHVRPRDGQTQELAIRDVAHDRWIDFAERRLDRQSLLQQLKSLSSAPAVAVSNIPYSKTIVSRCLVHSLDGTEAETPDSPDWLASVHQRAQDCPSLSATELVELAQEVDCRVEISWSRQHSQQGGLDAIFHRYQPLTGERVMFRFPTDHAERPLHSLSSRPLRQQFLQKTQQRLLEMLEAQLPTYMVPQTLAILDAMPVNQNGKVDRKALEQQIDTQKGQSGLKRQPETETQRTMQQLWAGVLAIDADSIGLDDSFFRLGGDSIAAMKLVGEARRAGIHLTVADLFRNPKLECLSRIGRKLLHRIVEPVLPFSLLPPAIKEDILSNQKSLGKINDLASIVDILPVTHSFNYFYVEMGPQLDLYLLRNSCRKVLDHLSILRSRFVPLDDQWFQIILHDLDLPFSVHDVNESLDEASHAICMQDIERTDPLEVPTSFKVVRYKSTHNRLIIRLSHAQYDGVSFPIILRTLISTYQQEPLHPVAEFSTFLAHARKIQTLSGRYWRELLQGSRPIRVTEKLRLQVQEDISPHLVSVEKYMDAPRLPEGITMASLISSAWALVLAHITGEQDIVFGHLVAGRNSDIPEVAEIVGPCLNVIPVRTHVYPIKTSKDLIQSVQDQHVSLGESDSMGWDEIVKDCTDWPAGTMYDSLVQHQNIITRPEISFAGVTAKLNGFQNPFGEARFLFLFSEPEDSQLKIMISGNTHFLTVERASLLVDMLAQTAQALSYSPQASLASHRLSLPGCAFNDG